MAVIVRDGRRPVDPIIIHQVYCRGDNGMLKGWLYDCEDMATMGRQNSETRFGRKLACCLSVCLLAISNRCSKDSFHAHKGLVTNWPHHTMLRLKWQ